MTKTWADNSSAPVWRLAPGDLQVCQIPLESEDAELSLAHTLLSEDERDRAHRFLVPEGARRFVMARAGLRRVLARYLDACPTELVFTYGPYGRPELAEGCNPVDLRFNLSHSGALAFVALALRTPVGIDIEECRELDDLEGIVNTAFAPAECACFERTPPSDRLRVFYTLWTAREAFSKAIGAGLSMPRDSIWIRMAGGNLHLETGIARAKDWRLYPLELPRGYCGAVAVHSSSPIRFSQFS